MATRPVDELKIIERFGPQANPSQSRHFFSGNPQLLGELVLSRFMTELVAHLC